MRFWKCLIGFDVLERKKKKIGAMSYIPFSEVVQSIAQPLTLVFYF